MSNPYAKDPTFYDGFNTPHTVFAECEPHLHRERRRILNPFFSRAGVMRVENMLFDKVNRLRAKLELLCAPGRQHPIRAENAFRCLTVDLITDYAFAKSKALIENSDDNFESHSLLALYAAGLGLWDAIYQPMIRKLANLVPQSWISMLSEDLAALFGLLDKAKASYESYKTSEKREFPVVFDGMKVVADDALVVSEAVDILIAGSDTTAFTLNSGIWYISKNPQIKRKLMEALKEALSDSDAEPTLLQLKAIPYLAACVRESLRVAMPVPGRLPRIVPPADQGPLIVDGQTIPPGTIVGMSAYTMHRSEELWGHDVLPFNPDRWLGEAGRGLESHLVTFSKGLRGCTGLHGAQRSRMEGQDAINHTTLGQWIRSLDRIGRFTIHML
ncbi:hypothetical protein KJ359_002096 [Pestalotiopsis sp. 9143b]|nr:hypothetical protein KJ359_002096 [Pestalotiopsis sp. 9143b]